jgi:hypothetical protein
VSETLRAASEEGSKRSDFEEEVVMVAYSPGGVFESSDDR